MKRTVKLEFDVKSRNFEASAFFQILAFFFPTNRSINYDLNSLMLVTNKLTNTNELRNTRTTM